MSYDSCSDYHHNEDTAKVVGGLIAFIIVAVVLIVDCIGKDEREAQARHERAAAAAACTLVVDDGSQYADPTTLFCGSKNGEQYLPGSFDACYKVLPLRPFGEIRHCWKEAMQKAAQSQQH